MFDPTFVYSPHVHTGDGSIVTPDILVERVFVVVSDGVSQRPTGHLNTTGYFQQTDEAVNMSPAYALVAAGFGMLIAPGAIFPDVLPLGREAFRCDRPEGLTLAMGSAKAKAPDGSRVLDLMGGPLEAGTAVLVASDLSRQSAGGRIQIALSGSFPDALNFTLNISRI